MSNIFVRLIFVSVYCIALMFLSIICFALFYVITVTMVFYSNLCFIVNLISFTVSAQPFRLCFMLVCISVIFLLCFLLFFVYSLFSVSLPDLANKDVNFWQVGEMEFDRLMSYDDKCFIRPGSAWRREFMSRWVKIPGGRAMMAVNQQGDVVGYGCRRPAMGVAESHIIGPLYADSYEIAWDLVQQLTRDVIGHKIEMRTT